jgi:hypothetical protein
VVEKLWNLEDRAGERDWWAAQTLQTTFALQQQRQTALLEAVLAELKKKPNAN